MHWNRLRVLFSAVLAAGLLAGCPTEPVELESGAVIGLRQWSPSGSAEVFKGIPYAAPPVGDLRWQPPEPPAAWDGVRAAFVAGPACAQSAGTMSSSALFLPSPDPCEDCLTLNVWRPAEPSDEPLPVMVWIHGGSFESGTGAFPVYDGSTFASKGMIVVTINYRLGSLGYLAHPALSAESPHGVSGNYGLLDQIAALQWVQDNAAAFGGDPDRVTVVGHSAGSMSVGFLLVSPLAEGLFQRAIMQSGVPWPALPLRSSDPEVIPSAEVEGLAWAEALGVQGDGPAAAEALRALPTVEILGIEIDIDPWDFRFAFSPSVDGVVLPDQPLLMMQAGDFNRVPLLIGSTRDEATVFMVGSNEFIRWRAAEYEAFVEDFLGIDAASVLALYPPPSGFVFGGLNRLFSDFSMFALSRTTAKFVAAQALPVYPYYFTLRPANVAGEILGAHHGAEVPFVFDTLLPGSALTREDRELARAMQGYWARFIISGDPNGGEAPFWPPYDPETDAYLELGSEIRVDSRQPSGPLDTLEAILLRLNEDARAFTTATE